MRFANPSAFFLLIILAILAFLRERYRRKLVAPLPYPDLALLRQVASTWRSQLAGLPVWLLYAAIVLATIALARPQTVLKGEEARAKGIDIMMVLDTSASMRALDFDPQDRMEVAKRAAKNFIEGRHYDRIGLVVFAGVSLLQCPLTLDYAALLELLDGVDTSITHTDNTAIGTAIATAVNHLKKSAAKSKVLILITDGRSNSGEIDPTTAAKAAAALGIRIYTIGVGIHGTSKILIEDGYGKRLVPIQEDLDEPGLQDIAHIGNGKYYRAASVKEFDAIFSDIDKLERSDIQGPRPEEYRDLYLGWLIAAMILFSAAAIIEITLLRKFP